MKNLLLSIAVLFLYFSCSPDPAPAGSTTGFIPRDATYIFQIPDTPTFLEKVENTAFFSENNFLFNSAYKEQLDLLAPIVKNEIALLCFSKNEDESLDYIFISKAVTDSLDTDTIQKKSVETFQYESFRIKKYTLEDNSVFTSNKDGILVASNSRKQLEKILQENLQKQEEDEIFKKTYSAADTEKVSLFINHSRLDKTLDAELKDANLPLSSLAGWSGMDLDLASGNMVFNGISTWKEQENVLLKIFSNVSPFTNNLAQISPAGSAGFYSFTYNNFKELAAGLQSFTGSEETVPGDHFLNYTREAGIIFTAEENVLALVATDITLAGEAINVTGEHLKDHRNVAIYDLEKDPGLDKMLYPLVKNHTSNYYARLDEFILFSETPAALENVISSFLNKSTLGEQEYYRDAMKDLAGSSSLLMVANTAHFKERAQEAVSNDILPEFQKLDLSSYPVIALQFVGERNFAHLHGIFSTTRSSITNGVSQIATLELENRITTHPFLLTNHNNNLTEVAFQDDQNNLFLFSSEGKKLWQNQLNGQINSEIYQVDLFKNGNLQMAFTTPNAFYIFDRNGNTVKPFPINFKDEVTQPLSVFDYDNNRNYRFVVTQDRNLLMYDARGRIVKGFDYDRRTSALIQSPVHIRTGTKDYIVVPESNGSLHILSRQGKIRIPVKQKFDFSENRWYLNEGHFSSVNAAGELIRIDESGNVSRENTELPAPYFTATESTRVLHSENILKINSNTITLDFGLYSRPQIFSLRNKTYITITDTQAQKVFVFNENAELLPGFPVYGTSAAQLHANNEGNITLSVKAEDNSVLLYRL